jgi:RND family efflux transporter MFP subunit
MVVPARRRAVKRGLAAVAIVAALLTVALIVYRVRDSIARNAGEPAGDSAKALSVAVAVVEKKQMPDLVSITGVIRASNEATVFAKMPGRVTRVLVEVGQVVKEGEALAVLDAVEFGWRVKQAEAQLKAAQAGLLTARAQHKMATSAWERAQALHKKGALSQADFEQADAGFQLAAAGASAAEAQVALADAALGLANQTYADMRITSPIAGVVAKKLIDVGTQTGPGLPAFVVQDQRALKMHGTVPAADVARLAKGAPVRVTVDELPGRVLEGSLSSVAPTLEAESRRGAVEVQLAPAQGLLPYMFGHADIGFGTNGGVLVVPASAVLPTADGAVVWTVRSGKAVRLRPILGGRVADDIVITSGLQAGERVIISGDTGIKEGLAVSVAGEG